MQTEVKKTTDMVSIAELAKEFEVRPGVVYGVLSDLGIELDGAGFEADDESVELIKESLLEQVDSKEITLRPNPTPRDVAQALGVPQPEVQKTLMMKMKVMATLTTALKPEIAEQLVAQFGNTVRWADATAKPKLAA